MSEKEEITINKSDLESFVQNRVWKVLVQAIVDRTNDKMGENITIDPFKDPTTIARNQGYIDALSFVIDYPAVLMEQIEFEKKKEEKE